jgi:RNA polymerase sigma-70 factor (ECF subfamily)
MSHNAGNTTQLQHLLDQAAKGNDDAYAELISQASVRLQKLTAKMLRKYPHLRRWEQTDDVFQNAVIRLHRSLGEVKPDSVRHFLALAATQIRRTLVDLARHHFGPQGQAAKHHTDAGGLNSDGGNLMQNKADTDHRPETLQLWADFHEAVGNLSAEQREVFELVWYGELGRADIAELLGVSEPTVKRRLRAARVHLFKALDGNFPHDMER